MIKPRHKDSNLLPPNGRVKNVKYRFEVDHKTEDRTMTFYWGDPAMVDTNPVYDDNPEIQPHIWKAIATAGIDYDLVICNLSWRFYFNNKTVLHELGHRTGYLYHKDNSIMGYGYYDSIDTGDKPISEITRDIAKQWQGFQVMDWSRSDLRKVILDYVFSSRLDKTFDVSRKTLRTAIKKYAGSGDSDVYFTSNFNNFGGVYPDRDIETEYGTFNPYEQAKNSGCFLAGSLY